MMETNDRRGASSRYGHGQCRPMEKGRPRGTWSGENMLHTPVVALGRSFSRDVLTNERRERANEREREREKRERESGARGAGRAEGD